MSRFINHAAFGALREKVLSSLYTPATKQVWLVGPEGRGKTTFVERLFEELRNQAPQSHITTYFDFNSVKDYNFQTALLKFVDSLLGSASALTHSNTKSLERVFEDLRSRFTKFNEHSAMFFEHIGSAHRHMHTAQGNSTLVNSNKTWRDSLALANKSLGFDTWWKTCSLTYEILPKSFGVSSKASFNTAQAFLLFVNSIACRVDIAEAQAISANPSSLVTGRWAVAYLIESMRSFSKHDKRSWVMCNDGVEHLVRSPFLSDRGLEFLSLLIFNLQLSNLPSVFIANDSVSSLSLTSDYYRKVFNAPLKSGPDTAFDSNNFLFCDLPELPPDQVMSFLTTRMPCSDKCVKALCKLTGGNLHLINKVLSGYKDFSDKVGLGTVQQILAGSQSPVDDEYFPMNETKENQVLYLKEEQFKMFVKTLHDETLSEEVIKFENSVNEFLSNPAMESMRENAKNPVHFKVIVFETIRHMLEKRWMRLRDEAQIDNKVILALISANILHYHAGSQMFEFKNTLVKYMLRSYIDIEYEALKPVEKIEYKANLLLNQRTLYGDLDSLLV